MSTITLNGAKGGGDFLRLRFWGTVLLMLGALLALGAGSAFAAPLAGTSIGNQASASYTDANLVNRLTVSNSVATIVTAVGSATLTQSQSKVGAPGQTLAFPHTIQNTGNSPATFGVTISNVTTPGTFSPVPSAATVFADANCDGVADNNTAVSASVGLGPVAAGGQTCFVVQSTISGTALGGASGTFDVNFTSSIAGSTLLGSPNTDTVTVSANAVINVTKSISVSTGPNGTIVTYQLTYRNTGTVSAGNVVIADTLPATAAYIPGSATWSGTVLTLTDVDTDLQGTAPYRIKYGQVGAATVGGSVVAILEQVDPGVQGVIQFRAQMIGSGPLTINNNANWCYSDIGTGGAIVPGGGLVGTLAAGSCFNARATFGSLAAVAIADLTGPNGITAATNTAKTNIVPFFIPVVGAAGSLTYNDANSTLSGTTAAGDATNSTDGTNPLTVAAVQALNDNSVDIAVATAGQGTLATWDTTVWNTGGSTDTFNITMLPGISDFPSGTSFLLFRNDRFTPLTDSNNDGIVDTGPVAANARYMVHVVAVLPPSGGAATYSAVVQAASTNTGPPTNTVGLRLRVVSSRVDLRNNPFTGLSAGDGTGQTTAGEVAAVTGGIVAANPNTNAAFRLSVENTGSIPDSFNLSSNATSGAYTVADAFTTPTALPTGFVVKFYRTIGNVATCATTDLGPEVSNTGVIQPGAANRQNYCAIVTVPVGATAATYDLYFRALSPTTWVAPASTIGAADVLHNQLTINQVRSAAISPNNSGQGFPGGSVQYCHTVTNTGNSSETGLSVAQSAQTLNGTTGWGQFATVYFDTNSNCILDGTESAVPVTTPLALGTVTAGASVRFIVVVQVPGAAAAGQTNVNLFTLSGAGVTITQATATDTTSVVLGQVSLVKDQVLDTTCSVAQTSAGYGALTYTQSQLSAAPNTCIIYRVRATNVGTQPVTSVVINDVAPPNTALDGTNPVSSATNLCTAGGTSPNVTCTITPLNGGVTTTMYFRVRITP